MTLESHICFDVRVMDFHVYLFPLEESHALDLIVDLLPQLFLEAAPGVADAVHLNGAGQQHRCVTLR